MSVFTRSLLCKNLASLLSKKSDIVTTSEMDLDPVRSQSGGGGAQ